mmetsp:Transcript_20269/g.44259  ORF Transcript_20269/g.44259 Transcript_20269/m.44259 type:complete len:332 (-) Transcript_20269:427-1422(-)|eukprot:CAMPEP_0206458362 /NCGR_PEP_ID=MMETSP0324_2-20121206/23524_1 /ASSEMBLY_ACC=CAM_ASM_000836 /TAXON_ID=2866 /ORGANISM="Crypthecodinium cohnii, Strain Seligo" /LENGTH=331 /DNA_ID=CAMNT_0053929685 /DNA_START=110 /DNA_END=1105 /DNA_ORIENTATION=-
MNRFWVLSIAACGAFVAIAAGAVVVVIAFLWGKEDPDDDVPTAPRAASFLVLGDWGWDEEVHGALKSRTCQQSIADAMHEKMEELGDVEFVINVGDSFYPDGVSSKDDPQWDEKWRNVYSDKVRSVPWFSVYGNHDEHHDNCSCTDDHSQCSQVNGNISDLDFFYMPNVSWYYQHPTLDLEVIGLDQNHLASYSCQYTNCPETCAEYLKSKQLVAFDLFYERMEKSEATNFVVFSHYPTDYFDADYPEFLEKLTNSPGRRLTFLGGHRHNVDTRSVTSIYPNTAWLVGGGGGWGCEDWYGDEQGFLVGEIGTDGHVTTYPVLVNYSLCCGE